MVSASDGESLERQMWKAQGMWGEAGRVLTGSFSALETALKGMHLKLAQTAPTSASSALQGISSS